MKPNLIAIAIGKWMFPPAAFLADRLASLNPRSDVDIAIFSDAEEEMERARQLGVPAKLIFAKLPIELSNSATQRIAAGTFLKLFAPEFAGDDVRRILYLDADVYPENDNIFRLFDLDMGGFPVASTCDIHLVYTAEKSYLETELAKARVSGNSYQNGAVNLIDRENFLKAKIGKRAFNVALKHGFRVDLAFNRALAGKWLPLSPAMNAPMDLRGIIASSGYTPDLTHFIGKTKPWHGVQFASEHPARREIEAYLSKSPWRNYGSRLNGFQAAWDAVQAKSGGPTFAAPVKRETFNPSKNLDLQGLQTYLRNAEFADVAQGITSLSPRPSQPA